jgi:hypothetical protein
MATKKDYELIAKALNDVAKKHNLTVEGETREDEFFGDLLVRLSYAFYEDNIKFRNSLFMDACYAGLPERKTDEDLHREKFSQKEV